MVLTTSQTATSWMFSMFANATMAMTDVATELPCVAKSCRHCGRRLLAKQVGNYFVLVYGLSQNNKSRHRGYEP